MIWAPIAQMLTHRIAASELLLPFVSHWDVSAPRSASNRSSNDQTWLAVPFIIAGVDRVDLAPPNLRAASSRFSIANIASAPPILRSVCYPDGMDENHESADSLDAHSGYECVCVEILRPLDIDIWPFYVECRLVDAAGREWFFRDKWPIFTCADFDAQTEYPQPGVMGCQIIESRIDTNGRKVFVIDTEWPDHVDSTTGDYRFEVFANQLEKKSEANDRLD